MRVLKYLRGHIPAVALIVLLLVAQSFCELSLPAYTSRIVDTGIQSGGIEYAAPLALTDKTMDGVRLFCRMTTPPRSAPPTRMPTASGRSTTRRSCRSWRASSSGRWSCMPACRSRGRTPCSPCASRCRAAHHA